MSSRFIRGDSRPIFTPILTAQAVSVGDLCALSAGNVVRASDTTWASAVAAPAAPTVTAGGATQGTALTAAATAVKVSYQFPWGEGALSLAGSVTPGAGGNILLAGLALPAPAVALNVYVETAAGSGIFKLYAQYAALAGVQGIGAQVISGYGVGQAPPGSPVTSSALDVTVYNFAQSFLGVSGQTKASGTARAYGNSTDGVLRVDAASIWEFDTISASYNVGDLLCPAKDVGNALLNQQVALAQGEAQAIARCVEATTASIKVKGLLLSMKDASARRA